MFDDLLRDIELWGGEGSQELAEMAASETEIAYLTSIDELASGWDRDQRHSLPDDFASWLPDHYQAVVLLSVDRSKLNGYELVDVLKARQRLISRLEGELASDMTEIGYAAPGDATSGAARLEEAFEMASDEIRAALTLTRRAAYFRYDSSVDLVERLPRVHRLLTKGEIDLARARVFLRGTAHLNPDVARQIVDQLAEIAPRLTTGQLAARIRRLAIATGPDEARDRYETALDQRKVWMEQTSDGTGNLHLLDIPIDDLRAIGRRVNGHMTSLKKEDRSNRTHDQLRADIVIDFLLGSDPRKGGRGLTDIQVDLTTLAGLDDNPAMIPGLGPVIADVARQVADRQHKGVWQITVTDQGRVVDVFTTRRRPTHAISRDVNARFPVCTFPGCRVPAQDCDLDHLTTWADRGATSSENLAPACRHDHRLRESGWRHRRRDLHQHEWTSPLGHTYITQGQSP